MSRNIPGFPKLLNCGGIPTEKWDKEAILFETPV
jgi:hypothetical protein